MQTGTKERQALTYSTDIPWSTLITTIHMDKMSSFFLNHHLAGTIGLITGSTKQESDITKFYAEIYRHYAYGWMLKTFYEVPGIGKMGWSASSSPFQFVYIKPLAK